MRTYGTKNDMDCGDTMSNIFNARKSSLQRSDGKGAVRGSKLKRRLRTSMNKATRRAVKVKILKELFN